MISAAKTNNRALCVASSEARLVGSTGNNSNESAIWIKLLNSFKKCRNLDHPNEGQHAADPSVHTATKKNKTMQVEKYNTCSHVRHMRWQLVHACTPKRSTCSKAQKKRTKTQRKCHHEHVYAPKPGEHVAPSAANASSTTSSGSRHMSRVCGRAMRASSQAKDTSCDEGTKVQPRAAQKVGTRM